MRKSIFHEPWWLDAVAPGRWREIIAERGGRVAGYLHYAERMMGNLRICEMPPITRVLGPVIEPQGSKTESRLRYSHSIMQELMDALAAFDHVEMTLDPACNDVAAFLASGYDVRIMPNLLLDCRVSEETLWQGLRDKTRNLIRRARERLTVSEILDPEAFIAFYLGNLGEDASYFDVNLVRAIHAAATTRDQGRILAAIDGDGVVHAAVFFVWDADYVYYYLSTRDKCVADTGAVSLLIWEGIEIARKREITFDFDGVMTEQRYKFMAAFGGHHAARYLVSRTTPRFEKQRQLRGLARSLVPDWMRQKSAPPVARPDGEAAPTLHRLSPRLTELSRAI